ncbi:MAG: D-glycerate dehydrogenase [Nitrospirae bacterium]|nr:MAG: D-glycerate dehydrogenase [Nitrospirota bacterium]
MVYVSRRLPDPVMAELARRFTLIGSPADRPATRADLFAAAAVADAMAVTLTDRMDAELFAKAPRLKVVAVYAVGYDNVDVAAAARRGIVVTNTPDVLTESTADLTWALILAVTRRLPEAERLVREGKWEGWAPTQLLGTDVFGKTLGIIGMGRIGRAVARRAAGFRMNILYHNPRPLASDLERTLGARYVPLAQVLQSADIVTLHIPLTDSTRGMIGRAELALIRPTGYLINTARGAIVDEPALSEALERKTLAGAGLDVYSEEPHVHPRLRALPNVVLLPHIGSATHEARVKMGMMVIDNIAAVLDGREAPNRVGVARQQKGEEHGSVQ